MTGGVNMNKKVFIISTVFTLIPFINAFSDECKECTYIKTIIQDKKEIEPDILAVNVNVSVKGSKESEIINMLGEVDKSIRDLGFEYKGGKFSVYKNCWWENNKNKCEGFKGSSFYVFELKNPTDQNKIYGKLSYFSDKYKDKLDYSISQPEWTASKEKTEQIENQLKLSVIDKALSFTQQISKKLNKSCNIESLNYESDQIYPIPIYRTILMSTAESVESVSAPEPKKDVNFIDIKVKAEIICK
jgi:hypothetical protein